MQQVKNLTGFNIGGDSRFVSRMELIRVGLIFIKKGLFK